MADTTPDVGQNRRPTRSVESKAGGAHSSDLLELRKRILINVRHIPKNTPSRSVAPSQKFLDGLEQIINSQTNAKTIDEVLFQSNTLLPTLPPELWDKIASYIDAEPAFVHLQFEGRRILLIDKQRIRVITKTTRALYYNPRLYADMAHSLEMQTMTQLIEWLNLRVGYSSSEYGYYIKARDIVTQYKLQLSKKLEERQEFQLYTSNDKLHWGEPLSLNFRPEIDEVYLAGICERMGCIDWSSERCFRQNISALRRVSACILDLMDVYKVSQPL